VAKIGNAYVDIIGNFKPLMTQLSSSSFKSRLASVAKFGSLAIAGIGVAAVKASMDFDHAMDLISTQAGASRKEVEELKESVLDLSARSVFDPTELANALFRVESAGFRGAEAMKILTGSTKLATVGDADLESTTYAVVAAMKTAIKGTENMNKTLGTMNAIVGSGNLRMDDLTSALGTGVLPAAKAFNLSLKDVGAALDVMTSRGMGATQSATRLRMTFALMGAPSDAAKKALQEINISSDQLANTLTKKGLLAAVQLLADHLGEAGNKADQARVITEAFGGGRSSAAILTLVQNVDDLASKYGDLDKGAEQFNEKLREAKMDPENQLRRAGAQIQTMLVRIGADLAPKAAEEISAITKIITDPDLPANEKISEVMERITDDIESVIPEAAGIGAKIGLSIVKGLVDGFTHADLLGKIFIAGAFIRLLGGPGALGKVGLAMARPIVTGMSTGVSKGVGPGLTRALGTGAIVPGAATASRFPRLAAFGKSIGYGVIGTSLISGLMGAITDPGVQRTFETTLHNFFSGMTFGIIPDTATQANEEFTHLLNNIKDTQIGVTQVFRNGRTETIKSVNEAVQWINAIKGVIDKQLEENKINEAQAAQLQHLANARKEQIRQINNVPAAIHDVMDALNDPKLSDQPLTDIIHRIGDMAPAGQQAAADMLRDMAKEMVEKKQLPIKEYRRLMVALDIATDAGGGKINHSLAQVIGVIMPRTIRQNGKAIEEAYGSGVWDKLLGITEKKGTTLKQLADKAFEAVAHSADKNGKDTWKNWQPWLDQLDHDGKSKTEKFKNDVYGNFKSLTNATTGAIAHLSSETKKTLASFKVKGSDNIYVAQTLGGGGGGSGGGGGGGNGPVPAQQGAALVPGIAPGDRHTLALNGVPIAKVESGELISVANRTATSVLMGVNSRIQRRENGGVVGGVLPGFKHGGVPGGGGGHHKDEAGKAAVHAMIALANRFDAADEQYSLGGGHGSFLTSPAPVDCSGAVSAILHAGGLLEGAPMDTIALASWGQPAKGNEPLVVATRPIAGLGGHTVMSINGRIFGTSRLNPGGGAGWLPGNDPRAYVSGAELRTMDIAGGVMAGSFDKLAAIEIKGPDGPLRDLGQAAVDQVRGAANRYLAKNAPQVPVGSGGGGDPQLPGHDGIYSASWYGPIGGQGPHPEGAGQTPLVGKMFAELSNPPGSLNFSALGGLPFGATIGITFRGKTIQVKKEDVGAGGPGVNGHVRAVDLWTEAADMLPGFKSAGVADVKVTGLKDGGVIGEPGATLRPQDEPGEAFQSLVQRAWDFTAGVIPAKKGRVRVSEHSTLGPGVLGITFPGSGRVKLPRKTVRAILNPKKWLHEQAFGALIHEFAHVAQDRNLSDREAEGGADLFAHYWADQIATAMGIPFAGDAYHNQWGYLKFAQWVYSHKPHKWWKGHTTDFDQTMFRRMAEGGVLGGIAMAARDHHGPGGIGGHPVNYYRNYEAFFDWAQGWLQGPSGPEANDPAGHWTPGNALDADRWYKLLSGYSGYRDLNFKKLRHIQRPDGRGAWYEKWAQGKRHKHGGIIQIPKFRHGGYITSAQDDRIWAGVDSIEEFEKAWKQTRGKVAGELPMDEPMGFGAMLQLISHPKAWLRAYIKLARKTFGPDWREVFERKYGPNWVHKTGLDDMGYTGPGSAAFHQKHRVETRADLDTAVATATDALATGAPKGQGLPQGLEAPPPSVIKLFGKVWDASRRFFPGKVAQSQLVAAGPHDIPNWAWATTDHWADYSSRINLSDDLIQTLSDPSNKKYDDAFKGLVHEIAHAHQPPSSQETPPGAEAPLTRTETEGGAEAFALWAAPQIARALHVPYRHVFTDYPDKVSWVKHHHTAKWWKGIGKNTQFLDKDHLHDKEMAAKGGGVVFGGDSLGENLVRLGWPHGWHYNGAVKGSMSAGWIADHMIPLIEKYKPDVAAFEGGTNNTKGTDVRAAIQRLKEHLHGAALVLQTVKYAGSHSEFDAEINRVIEHSGADEISDWAAVAAQYLQGTNPHPSEAGYRKMHDMLKDAVNKAKKEGGKGGEDGEDDEDKPEGDFSGAHAIFDPKKLRKLREKRAKLDERILVREALDARASSEWGSELSPAERDKEIALNQALLKNLETQAAIITRVLKKFPEGNTTYKKLHGWLVELVGITGRAGDILEVENHLDDLGAQREQPIDYQQLSDLRQDEIDQLTQTILMMRNELPIFQQIAAAGGIETFHGGGVVGDRIIRTRVNEGVFTQDQMDALGAGAGASPQQISVVVEDGAVNSDYIRVEVNNEIAKQVRRADRRRGRGPVTGMKVGNR
jgi:TP901 family phage tail tape measure protein